MPINFDLKPFATISNCFCETGTYLGSSVVKALEAGFTKIATIEISKKNQLEAKCRIKNHPSSSQATIEYIQGGAAAKIGQLIEVDRITDDKYPVFWLDAHTHVFNDGTRTGGNPCPLLTEIRKINEAFRGQAILLVDDLRIIGGSATPPRNIQRRLMAAAKALFNPDALLTTLKPGWGKSVDLLDVLRLALDVPDVSFCLLDGYESKDVLCVFPNELNQLTFRQNAI